VHLWYQTQNYFFDSPQYFFNYILNLPQSKQMLEKVKDREELMCKVEKGCLEKYIEMNEGDQD
jgi:hypothetical protein